LTLRLFIGDNGENSIHIKVKVMGRLLLFIGLILVVLWLLGLFAFQWHSPLVHVLVIIGVIMIIFDLLNTRRNWW
jgi:hypothetical protein